jgi:hypothetical protein
VVRRVKIAYKLCGTGALQTSLPTPKFVSRQAIISKPYHELFKALDHGSLEISLGPVSAGQPRRGYTRSLSGTIVPKESFERQPRRIFLDVHWDHKLRWCAITYYTRTCRQYMFTRRASSARPLDTTPAHQQVWRKWRGSCRGLHNMFGNGNHHVLSLVVV